MNRRRLLQGLGAAALGGCVRAAETPHPAAGDTPAAQPSPLGARFVRGMNLAHLHQRGAGYGSAASRKQHERLWALGVRNVALNPFAYVHHLSDPEVKFGGDDTMRDDDLLAEIGSLRERGFDVTMKPHLWSMAFMMGKGNGDLSLDAPGWQRWFDSFTRYVTYYAAIAAKGGCSHLCVGLEYTSASRANPGAWAKVAAECRQTFGGVVFYAANWYEEWELFADWASFDLVGVNAYFPLTGQTVDELVEAWRAPLDGIERVAAGRPVVFPECGYRAVSETTLRPWDPEGHFDPSAQARAYEALLRSVAARPSFGGTWWWKWFTDLPGEADSFVPADLPAEATLRAWYTA